MTTWQQRGQDFQGSNVKEEAQMMKVCTHCLEEKERVEFSKGSGGKNSRMLQNICKKCRKRIYDANRYVEQGEKLRGQVYDRRERIRERNVRKQLEYLRTHPCVDCGEADPVVLEFDHKDNVEKVDGISNLLYFVMADWDSELVQTEIEKCVVLCANCHKRRTAQQLGWLKYKLATE